MKVKELIEKLSKLNPELECYTIDYSAEWQTIDDAWLEQANQKDIAYLESSWSHDGMNEGGDMLRWHYTSKFACPDRDCIVLAELENDEYVLLRYNCDKCTFRDYRCALMPSQEIKRWTYVSEIVTVLDRMTELVSDAETAFGKYINNQTDSVTGTVEMKTGEVSYEV